MVPISAAALLTFLVWILVAGLIFWILWWVIGVVAPPEPFRKIAIVVLAFAAAIFCINLLLSLVGHPMFVFR